MPMGDSFFLGYRHREQVGGRAKMSSGRTTKIMADLAPLIRLEGCRSGIIRTEVETFFVLITEGGAGSGNHLGQHSGCDQRQNNTQRRHIRPRFSSCDTTMQPPASATCRPLRCLITSRLVTNQTRWKLVTSPSACVKSPRSAGFPACEFWQPPCRGSEFSNRHCPNENSLK